MAGLAVTLEQRKLLTPEDCVNGLASGVNEALSRWLERMFAGLKFFSFKAHLYTDVYEACGTSWEESVEAHGQARLSQAFREACDLDVHSSHVAIGLYATANNWILVGDQVERLEALCPGLGWAALGEIQAACIDFNLFEFGWIEQAASYTYWGGADDEKEMLEAYGESESDYDGVTREAFEADIPVKKMRQAKRLPTRVIAEMAKDGSGNVAEIADLICRLRRLKNAPPICRISVLEAEFDWFDSLEPTVVLGWKSWELVNRLTDDYAEILYNGDSCLRDLTALLPVPLGDGKALAEMEMKWRGAIKRLRYADRLLDLVGV